MFVLYGIATVLNTVVFTTMAGAESVGDVLRMLLHPLGAGFVAWGLWRGARWAWWIGLALALSVLAAGVSVIAVFEHGDLYWLPPSDYQLFFVSELLSVSAAVALLLAPSARAVVRSCSPYSWGRLLLRDDHARTLIGTDAVHLLMKTHW
jgi:hypothetical protein